MPEINIEQLMRAAQQSSANGKGDESLPDADAQIKDLIAIKERYTEGCPFKVGDLVTPRKGFNLRGVDQPAIVLQVLEKPLQDLSNSAEQMNSCMYGCKIDMRVLRYSDSKTIVAWWEESWKFRKYSNS